MRYDNRLTSRQRGYTRRWEKERLQFLAVNPLCAMCAKQGRTTIAQVVDHIVPHKGDQVLFWDRDNWQPLCKPHHDSTKQAEDIHGFSSELGDDGWPVDPKHPANRRTP